jgi:hypothetical protein
MHDARFRVEQPIKLSLHATRRLLFWGAGLAEFCMRQASSSQMDALMSTLYKGAQCIPVVFFTRIRYVQPASGTAEYTEVEKAIGASQFKSNQNFFRFHRNPSALPASNLLTRLLLCNMGPRVDRTS